MLTLFVLYFGVNLLALWFFNRYDFEPKDWQSYVWGLIVLLFGCVICTVLFFMEVWDWLFEDNDQN